MKYAELRRVTLKTPRPYTFNIEQWQRGGTMPPNDPTILNIEESWDLEFKRDANAIDREDLVAFANAENGGKILAGVEQIDLQNGQQGGRVVGCDVSDKSRQRITSLADTCVPKIKVIIFTRTVKKMSYFEIQIPSGDLKPYCTTSGTYKTRVEGRNESLTPEKLLALYLKQESGKFLASFKEATVDLKAQVASEFEKLSSAIEDVNNELNSVLIETSDAAKDAADETSNIASTVDEIHLLLNRYLENNEDKHFHITEGRIPQLLSALLKHFNIEDPKITSIKNFIRHVVLSARNLSKGKVREKDFSHIWNELEKDAIFTKEMTRSTIRDALMSENLSLPDVPPITKMNAESLAMKIAASLNQRKKPKKAKK